MNLPAKLSFSDRRTAILKPRLKPTGKIIHTPEWFAYFERLQGRESELRYLRKPDFKSIY